MKTYNSKVENGIKSLKFSLEGLMESESITDSRLESIRKELEDLVVEAQLGTIDNNPSIEEQEENISNAHRNRGY